MFSLTDAVPVFVLPEPWLKPVEVEVELLDVPDGELPESPPP